MKTLAQTIAFLVFIVVVMPSYGWPATPCDDVNRSLPTNSKASLALVIATQLHPKKVDVLQSFRLDRWTIIYVDSHEADEVFLFYSADPLRTQYVVMWSGAAEPTEEQSIREWTLKNARGIPPKLASCFAWYVTNGRK